jgi:plasmid maintenance system antidote protein VapI
MIEDKMTRTAVSRVVNGKAGISIEMAIRLEALLGTSSALIDWIMVSAVWTRG